MNRRKISRTSRLTAFIILSLLIGWAGSSFWSPLSVSAARRQAVKNRAARVERQQGPTQSSAKANIKPELRAKIADIIARKHAQTPNEMKIDHRLRSATAAVSRQINSAGPSLAKLQLSRLSNKSMRVSDQGEVQLYISLTDLSSAKLDELKANGFRQEIALPDEKLVQGWAPHTALNKLAAFDFVRQMRLPGYRITRTGRILNEGNPIHHFDLAQALFFNPATSAGAGVNIGVLSSNITNIDSVALTGDAPPSSAINVFVNTGPNVQPGETTPEDDEGTALIEILFDIVPGATFQFYGPNTSAEMVDGINHFKATGAKIIVDDLSFRDEPKFEDGMIATAARSFVTGGGVYVTSAGNDAQEHYYAAYNPTATPTFFKNTVTVFNSDPNNPNTITGTYNRVHNFATSGTAVFGDTFTLPDGEGVDVLLQWNNQFGAAQNDLDMFLIDATNNDILDVGINTQGKLNNSGQLIASDPEEEINSYINFTGAPQQVFLMIAEDSNKATAPSLQLSYTFLQTDGFFPTRIAQNVMPNDSLFGHETVEELITVGALDHTVTPFAIEDFSSRGPAHLFFPSAVTRTHLPSVVAVDGISHYVGQITGPNPQFDPVMNPDVPPLTTFFDSPFFGTSAAAPQVAGLAALILSAHPGLTPTQVKAAITSSAHCLVTPCTGGTFYDNTYGFGEIDGAAAVGLQASASSPKLAIIGVNNQSSPALDFGTVNRNASGSQTVNFQNVGGTALTVSSIGNPGAPFSVSGQTAPFTLQPGQTSGDIVIRFSPTSGNQATGSLTLTSNDPSAKAISLTGVGRTSVANDNCSTPMALTSQAFTVTEDIGTATAGFNDPSTCSGSAGTQSVWFTFKATTSGSVSLNTSTSSYQTILSVYTGSCSAFSSVACNQATSTSSGSSLTFSATAGTTYLVEVAATSPVATGTLVLSGLLPINPPTEDELSVDFGGFDPGLSLGIAGLTNPAPFYAVNRLTPKTYPATLDQVKLQFLSTNGVKVGDPFQILIAANPALPEPARSGIGGLSFQTINATVPVLDQFFSIPVPNRTITSGDLVVGFVIVQAVGAQPAAEEISPSSQRSYFSFDGVNFLVTDSQSDAIGQSLGGNFAIRALVKDGTPAVSSGGVNFGNVSVNSVGNQTINITNSSTNDATISAISALSGSPAFSLTGVPTQSVTLHPGDVLQLGGRFAPTAAGTQTATFTVTLSQGSPITVTLTGNGAQSGISINPLPVAVGNVNINQSGQKTFTVTNTGTSDLHIQSIGSPGAPFFISGIPTLPFTLTAGNSLPLTATFQPTTAGDANGSFLITSDAPTSPTKVSLTGHGAAPRFTVNPSPVAFGSVPAGTTATPIPVTLTNTSNDVVTINSISTPAAPFTITNVPTLPLNINPGLTATFNIGFTATSAAPFTGSVNIGSNSIDGANFTLNLSGSGGQPKISLSTSSIDFGPFKSGRISTKQLIVSNTGIGSLSISAIPQPASPFSVSGVPSLPATVAPGSSLTLNVNFAPPGGSTANFSSSFTISSNDAGTPTSTINLTGSGSLVNHAPVANPQNVSASTNSPNTGTLTGSDPDNDPITFALVNQASLGTVVIQSNGQFTYTAGSQTGTDSFTFKVNDGSLDSAPATASVTITNFIYGDVNGDKVVDSSDLVLLANILAGNVNLSPPAADVFKDGVINSADLVTLANFLAGNIVNLPVIPAGGLNFSPNSPSFTDGLGITTQDFLAITNNGNISADQPDPIFGKWPRVLGLREPRLVF